MWADELICIGLMFDVAGYRSFSSRKKKKSDQEGDSEPEGMKAGICFQIWVAGMDCFQQN